MANLSLNIEAIRVQMGFTRVEMAEKMNISIDRYNRLASGDSKMLAAELVSLHKIRGVPYENIKVIS